MGRYNILWAIAAAALIVTGCSQQKSNATKVLEAVENSLAEVREDAKQYAPDGLKGVEAQVERLKASLENKDYNDVIAGTPQLSKAVDSLKSAVAAGKEHARAALAAASTEWESLSVEVPKMVETRVDELSAKKRLPWGVKKEEFDRAKTEFDSMKALWDEASKEAQAGDKVEAVEKAKSAKQMNAQIREQLKIKEA